MTSKKNKNQTKEKTLKTYNIKMPVYTTSIIEKEEGFFEKVTYKEMISFLKTRLLTFTQPFSTDNRNKTKRMVISKITPIDVCISDVPSVLLQINAFKTNLYDGYFEASEKIPFSKDNKIGSDSNFVLFYPCISGIYDGNYSCYFLMLAYEDPTKDTGEVSKLAKIVANRILNIPVQNIKLDMILQELKSIGTIPELSVKYYSLTEAENNIDVKYACYLDSSKLKKEEFRNFKDMPFDDVKSLLSDSSEDGNYQKKETTIFHGRREYKISKQLVCEAEEFLKETAEKTFNAQSSITQKELEEKIHDIDFMTEKMEHVLSNYISGFY